MEAGVFPISIPSIKIFAPSGSESKEIVSVEPVKIVAQPLMTTEMTIVNNMIIFHFDILSISCFVNTKSKGTRIFQIKYYSYPYLRI
jgi:hypothetical protein